MKECKIEEIDFTAKDLSEEPKDIKNYEIEVYLNSGQVFEFKITKSISDIEKKIEELYNDIKRDYDIILQLAIVIGEDGSLYLYRNNKERICAKK